MLQHKYCEYQLTQPMEKFKQAMFRNSSFEQAVKTLCEVVTSQLYSYGPHPAPSKAMVTKPRQNCARKTVGRTCSGLWELTNQSRLGFAGEGALKRQALKRSIQTED